MNLEEKLKKLGYFQEWIDSGILTLELLDQQIADQVETGHQCTEHYRYGAFHKWLSCQGPIERGQIDSYLYLARCDSDKPMAGSAVIALLKSDRLSDEDFGYIVNSINDGSEWISKEISKERMRRQVSNALISDSVFNSLISEGDSHIHQKLLNHPDVSRERMGVLSKRGASKKIRNIANQKYNTNSLWHT